MRYRPFRLKDHPYIAEDLASVDVDLSIARLGKNAICLPDKIVFSANYVSGMKSVVVPLDKEGYEKANLGVSEKMCLRRILDLLEQADENDLKIVQKRYGAQYELTRAFRGIDQNFGGKRFVDLARDMIDSHMGICLYPYMASDLVMAVYMAYNKNVNRDVAGFMSSVVEMIGDLIENDGDLRSILLQIAENSSEKLYLDFIDCGLKDERIGHQVADSITELFAEPNRFRINHAEAIPLSVIQSFPKECLISFLQRISRCYSYFVTGLFRLLGGNCDPAYLEAYQRNPDYDISVLAESPAFQKLDPESVQELKMREWILDQQEGKDIVVKFASLSDTKEQMRFLQLCKEEGWKDLALALDGEPFSARGFDLETFAALLPYMNLELERNRQQAVSFVREKVNYYPQAAERLLLSLRHPCFGELVREALKKDIIRDFPSRVILADRFHCPDAVQIKEWH